MSLLNEKHPQLHWKTGFSPQLRNHSKYKLSMFAGMRKKMETKNGTASSSLAEPSLKHQLELGQTCFMFKACHRNGHWSVCFGVFIAFQLAYGNILHSQLEVVRHLSLNTLGLTLDLCDAEPRRQVSGLRGNDRAKKQFKPQDDSTLQHLTAWSQSPFLLNFDLQINVSVSCRSFLSAQTQLWKVNFGDCWTRQTVLVRAEHLHLFVSQRQMPIGSRSWSRQGG